MSSDFRACARCGDDGGYHLSWCTNRPTPADVTREPTGGQELRALLIDTITEHAASWDSDSQGLVAAADAVLALPELAALLADADNWRRATTGDPTQPEPLAMQARTLLARVRELEATVTRVRELAARFPSDVSVIGAGRLRRALDGEPQP